MFEKFYEILLLLCKKYGVTLSEKLLFEILDYISNSR